MGYYSVLYCDVWDFEKVWLLLSGDLFRLYGLGFSLGFIMVLQILVGMMLSWLFFSCFICMNWMFMLFIMLDFDLGFVLSSMHMVFTSLMYLLLYMHLFKAIFLCLLFDSSLMVWMIGFMMLIFMVLMAFMGYMLPATSMSYWGLTVLSNVLATVPSIGMWLCYWLWGSEYISDFTLLKMHSLHMFLPFILLFVVLFHLFCMHYFLSSDGLSDSFSFYYERFFFLFYYVRDVLLFLNIMLFTMYFMCMNWYFVFHEESWIIVDTLKTSDKILPEFFFFEL